MPPSHPQAGEPAAGLPRPPSGSDQPYAARLPGQATEPETYALIYRHSTPEADGKIADAVESEIAKPRRSSRRGRPRSPASADGTLTARSPVSMIGDGADVAGGRYWVRTSDPSLVRHIRRGRDLGRYPPPPGVMVPCGPLESRAVRGDCHSVSHPESGPWAGAAAIRHGRCSTARRRGTRTGRTSRRPGTAAGAASGSRVPPAWPGEG